MNEQRAQAPRTLPQRVIHKIGELAGLKPPEWFDQEVWDQMSSGQRRMAKIMHDRGGEGFRILRSAEAPMRQYTRE